MARDSSGFSEYDGEILGLTLSFYLTVMVHFPQSNIIHGVKLRRGEPALALRNHMMATTLACVDTREVLRCEKCKLVQYRTGNSLCRRCHQPLDIEEPAPLTPQLVTTQPVPHAAEAGMQVAGQVREIRRARHLSQRQLAGRMQVPRTYISKIENGKATPTLSSLERLAAALEVDICKLVHDARSRRNEETASIFADPFLAEIAPYVAQMDALQRSIFLNQVRDMATGRRKSA